MTDSIATLNKKHSKDNSALYEEIGNSVIERAHAGDPTFERVFEAAWNKVKNGAKH